MARLNWQARIAQLRRDQHSSVSEITWRVADLLIEAISAHGAGNASGLRRWLLDISRQLIAAKPAVAPVFRLVNGMLWAADGAEDVGGMRRAAVEHIVTCEVRAEEAMTRLVAQVSAALTPYRRLMVFGGGEVARRALLMLATAKAERPPQLYCSEERPSFAGLALASELAAAGLPVTIGIDLALFAWLPRMPVLVVGCEALAPSGLVGRLGTAPLAALARELEVPVLAICPGAHMLPEEYAVDIASAQGDREQIMVNDDEHLTVSNAQLDLTPLESLSAVISESGALAGPELRQALAEIRIYPGLRG